MSRFSTACYRLRKNPAAAKRMMRCWGLLLMLLGCLSLQGQAAVPFRETGNASHTGLDNAAASVSDGPEASPEFLAGVKAYREGNYLLARKTFSALHGQMPEDSTMTYYLAISEAQLGHFSQARTLYQEIMTLDPNGEAGHLASEGLQYLPGEAGLDHPPRFQSPGSITPAMLGANVPANSAGAPQPNGMSPQDLMMLQMMMNQPGNNQQGGGGFNNMLPYLMMSQNGQAGGGTSGIDPQVMSNMLMNQMLQNFSMDSGKDQN